MKKNRVKNPLIKRVPRELKGDWKKYLLVSLFLILTIGFVSGMYVANGSMMRSAQEGAGKYKLEDGHFELNKKAGKHLVSSIESGKKADVKQYYTKQARKELDEKFEDEFKKKFDEEFESKVKKPMLVFGLTGAYEKLYKKAYDEAYEKAYEEAWKEVSKEIDEKYADAEEKYELNDLDFKEIPVQVYENFYRNEEEDKDSDGTVDGTVRVYKKTEEINQACVMEGKLPETENEIAIDRMHADNAGIQVGDTVTVGGNAYEVAGLIAYVNYATLHEKSTDLIFDAIKFDVAMVTEGGFERLQSSIHYAYAWKYRNLPADEKEEKELSDDFMKALLTQTVTADNKLEDYLPRYANPAINFATDDMGSDEAMGGVLLDILIVIIAFIFAVTISNTIAKESSVIGTLRASGYTQGELVRHYLVMPVIVTLIAACVGNLLGYTVFKNAVVSMYYNSYSLPAYETIWNAEAFLKTTLVPVVLMFLVNLIVILKMMQHTPLQFLRHDLKKSKRKKAMRLPRWKFMNRFRLRIIFQNIPNYLILFVGIFFIAVMLAMAVGMPATLDYYKENTTDMMFSKYQYILKAYEDEDGNLVETKNPDAEKFDMNALLQKGESMDEEVSVYGIVPESRYVKISGFEALEEDEVYISSSYQEKYGIQTGDTISLDEKYENKKYTFVVAGIYEKCQSIAVFLPADNYQSVFDLKKGQFSGYLSDSKITDITQEHIATVISKQDILKMCDQLDHSMGAYMEYFQVLCILLSAVLIYLLTKIIIEKNENAISMTKILGYENKEIAGLYLTSTTVMLVLSDLLSVFLGVFVMSQAWKVIMAGYSGWFAFVMTPAGYIKTFLFILTGYLIVMCFDFQRIKRIPMDKALKNME